MFYVPFYISQAALVKKKHCQQIACTIATLILQYASQAFVATKLSMLRCIFYVILQVSLKTRSSKNNMQCTTSAIKILVHTLFYLCHIMLFMF